jgi:hypothetical protein
MRNTVIVVMEGGIIHHIASSIQDLNFYMVDHDREEDEGDDYDPASHFHKHLINERLVVDPMEYIRNAIEMPEEKFNMIMDSKASEEEGVSIYQALFEHMSQDHNLTLTQGEMDDIIHVVNEMQKDPLIVEAEAQLKKADSGSPECKIYNDGFLDGVQFALRKK